MLRPGGYTVIFSQVGDVAVVSAPGGLFLPGGGQDGLELPEDAAIREAWEECGLDVVLGRLIGTADELVFAVNENIHYRKRCTFFLANIRGIVGQAEPDHKLLWVPPADAMIRLHHKSQRWAVSEARRLKRQA